MLPEELYEDLFAIASEHRALDQAVDVAQRILALPRYAGETGRLAQDIRSVIARIPDAPSPPDERKATTDGRLREQAELHFSLVRAGESISRRRIAVKDPGGSARFWMDIGVIYCVATGLLELWSREAPATTGDFAAGYTMETVTVSRRLESGLLGKTAIETLDYRVAIHRTGAHVLLLPVSHRYTTLRSNLPMRPPGYTRPQLVAVGGPDGAQAAIVFSAIAGESFGLTVEHRQRSPGRGIQVSYPVEQPIGTLWLKLDLPNGLHQCSVSENATVAWHLGRLRRKVSWACSPILGTDYSLAAVECPERLGESHEVESASEHARMIALAKGSGQKQYKMLK